MTPLSEQSNDSKGMSPSKGLAKLRKELDELDSPSTPTSTDTKIDQILLELLECDGTEVEAGSRFDREMGYAKTALTHLINKDYILKTKVLGAIGDRKTVLELFPDADIHDLTKEEWCKNAVLVAKKDMYNQAIDEIRKELGL